MASQGIPVIGPMLNKIIGTRNERFVKRYTSKASAINAREPHYRALTDAELRGVIAGFRERIKKGERPDEVMVDAFAAAREAMDRAVGIRNIFDPRLGFDPATLPEEARAAYARTKAEMDERATLLPKTINLEQGKPAPQGVPDAKDEFLGARSAIPGWAQIDIPNEIYDAVRGLYPESRPPFRARPFDVQLIGAMVLYQGKIAEMRTGEGKTIVAPLAAYLACCERWKVHVVTVNDYLVQRDRDWTSPFFRALGLTVGAIHPQHMQGEDEKRKMYRCDVVYGTTSEFGFDYLRDNMKRSVSQQVQRRREFAIVDEVDSTLIDEARTPLIISGPAHDDQPRYELADRLARHLVERQRPWQEVEDRVLACQQRIKGLEGDIRQARDKAQVPDLQEKLKAAKAELPKLESERSKHVQYYETHLERKQVHLTHDGIAEAQRVAGMGSFYVDQNIDVPHLLEQALRGHVAYQLDRDYVVMDVKDPYSGKAEPGIVIVDVNTGRPMIGRQWSDGLHQAIECKERVPIKQETQTVATVTIQNFFKMYKRLAGMTGTADTEAQEFHDIYGLDVVSIPTNKPVIRRDRDDLVFLRIKDKWNAIVDEIKEFHDVGRPILVGTTSVEKSESLSKMLSGKHGVKHEVLNAKQHEREAHIVENAGQLGAVMIATNMAGRGTDIKLGVLTREALLEHWLKRGIAPRTVTPASTDDELREAVFRKIAPLWIEIDKKAAAETPLPDLELRLLRAWCLKFTWLSEGKINGLDAEGLRRSLDDHGRFLLHRIRWFGTIEDMGGLHVIGTERHESRRIDNQLRGRSGRQGDRGSSRFFVSLEDDLMKMFAGETTMAILARLGMKEGDAIEHPMLSKSVERAQRKVEERNFQVRKNILEYDEVMEHQRQFFYGLRQRVLEGRDVKGLLHDYIRSAVDDAADDFLSPTYPARCASEHIRQQLECTISPDRLKGKDAAELHKLVRNEAKADARTMIETTLGEYVPQEGSEIAIDFDSDGLVAWAKSRFGVELNGQELMDKGLDRAHVKRLLTEAAEARIDVANLDGLDPFLERRYGVRQFTGWVKDKFGIEIDPEEVARTVDNRETPPQGLVMDKARAKYQEREVLLPVDSIMQMTMMAMQQSPTQAMSMLVDWANRRYELGWTPEKVRSTVPAKVREELLTASRAFVESPRMAEEVKAAQACVDDDALDTHLKSKFGVGIPEWMRDLREQERADAIQARVESILRAEALQFEQAILLETLDHNWKDHLHSMDQLRDGISFRAFSQQDPRTAFKTEGSRIFQEMLQDVRDRITDYIFKAQLTPQFIAQQMGMRPPMPRPPVAAPRPAPLPASGAAPAGFAAGSITGPGLDLPVSPPAPPTKSA